MDIGRCFDIAMIRERRQTSSKANGVASRSLRICFLLCIPATQLVDGFAQEKSEPSVSKQIVPARRDGQHDFDFEIGTWKTHLSRRLHPLTGSTDWVEYDGKTIVRKVWNGRANLVELDVTGPAGHIEGLSLRLYNPESHQWSLNFSNSAGGTLSPPVFGDFRNGRGEFFGRDSLNGRAILVRFVISDIAADSCRSNKHFPMMEGRPGK
jgi:hypothetical protein